MTPYSNYIRDPLRLLNVYNIHIEKPVSNLMETRYKNTAVEIIKANL